MTVRVASTTDTDAEVKDASQMELSETKDDPFGLTSAPSSGHAPDADTSDDATESEETPAVDATSKETDEVPLEDPVDDGDRLDATTEDEPEDSPVDETPTDPVQTAPAPRKRRRRGRSYKERASQLAREKAAETQRANALDLELQRLRSLAASQPPGSETPERTPVNAAPPEDVPVASPETTTPDAITASAKPLQENFETYDEFQEAIVDWKVSERLTHHEAQQRDRIERDRAQRAQEDLVAAHTARIDTFRSEHGDFDAVVTAGKDLPMTRPMQDAVLNSESGPAMMYHLCQNPEECDRIAAMNPILALKEMGRLEGRLEAAPPGPTSTTESITKAPRPIKPVGGGATASTIQPDQMSYQDYKRYREKQEAAEGR